jgi:hypothetical protein
MKNRIITGSIAGTTRHTTATKSLNVKKEGILQKQQVPETDIISGTCICKTANTI